MRVISGKFKGKRLFAPKGDRVRPTTDRVKETLFNILFSKGYEGEISVLDLFCGTGSLGIEALSRGATTCVSVDIDKESCALTQKNLAHVGATTELFRADYKVALKNLEGRSFDVIFIDPPFKAHIEHDVVTRIMAHNILAEKGVIVIEHDKSNPLKGLECASFNLLREDRVLGNTVLTFLERAQAEVNHVT